MATEKEQPVFLKVFKDRQIDAFANHKTHHVLFFVQFFSSRIHGEMEELKEKSFAFYMQIVL